jgi:hypothetical protein
MIDYVTIDDIDIEEVILLILIAQEMMLIYSKMFVIVLERPF